MTTYVKLDTHPGSSFGCSVDISQDGDTIVVGAMTANECTGAVYVFRRSGPSWIEEAVLESPTAHPGSYFGASVSVSGDGAIVAVGRPEWNSDVRVGTKGAVHLFRRQGSTYVTAAELVSDNGGPTDWFGTNVALSADGETLAVTGVITSGPKDSSAELSMYRCSRAGWQHKKRVIWGPNTVSPPMTVAISEDGEIVVVGVGPSAYTVGGVALVYRWDAVQGDWAENGTLQAVPFTYDPRVAVSGELIVVGTTSTANPDGSFGSAHLYEWDGAQWKRSVVFSPTLVLPTLDKGQEVTSFGCEVSVSSRLHNNTTSDYVAVSASTYSDSLARNRGAVYVFRRNQAWSQTRAITIAGAKNRSYFGTALAIANDTKTAVAGAYSGMVYGDDAAYVVHLDALEFLGPPFRLPDLRFAHWSNLRALVCPLLYNPWSPEPVPYRHRLEARLSALERRVDAETGQRNEADIRDEIEAVRCFLGIVEAIEKGQLAAAQVAWQAALDKQRAIGESALEESAALLQQDLPAGAARELRDWQIYIRRELDTLRVEWGIRSPVRSSAASHE